MTSDEIIAAMRQRGHHITKVTEQGVWLPFGWNKVLGVWVDWATAAELAQEPGEFMVHYGAYEDGRFVQFTSAIAWADNQEEAVKRVRAAARRRHWELEISGVCGGSVKLPFDTGVPVVWRYHPGWKKVSL